MRRQSWAKTSLVYRQPWFPCACLLASLALGCDATKGGADSPDGTGGATHDGAVNGTSGAGGEADTSDAASTAGGATHAASSTATSAAGADGNGSTSDGNGSASDGGSGGGGDGSTSSDGGDGGAGPIVSGFGTTRGDVGKGGTGPDGVLERCIDGSDSWGPATLLEADVPEYPQVAMNDAGDAIVTWSRSNVPWTRTYTRAAGWRFAERIRDENGNSVVWAWSEDLPVALTEDGSATVIAARDGAITAAHRQGPEERWAVADPMPIGPYIEPGPRPVLAVTPNGNTVIVWVEHRTQTATDPFAKVGDRIWSAVLAPDGGWEHEGPVQSAWGADNPHLAMNRSGNAVAVWTEPSSEFSDVHYLWSSRSEAGVGWTKPELIQALTEGEDPFAEDSANYARVAIDAAGNVTAVWNQDDGRMWANRFTPDAGWGDPEVLDAGLGDAYAPRIGMDADGNVMVIWGQGQDASFQLWSRRFTIASGWETPEVLSDPDDCWDVEVGFGAAGDVVAVWTDGDFLAATLWANRYVPGSGWAEPEIVDVESEGGSLAPDVAVDGAGNAVVVWRREEPDQSNLLANTFCRGL